MNDDVFILEAALKSLQNRLDDFIGACMNEEGEPKAPARKDLARMRGYLPRRCKHAFK